MDLDCQSIGSWPSQKTEMPFSNPPRNRFIRKLYTILQHMESKPPCERFVHWNDKGDAVVISSVPEFTKALPSQFKTKSYSSFVRQLNMYSFYKVKDPRSAPVFRHPFFARNSPDALRYVKRKRVVAKGKGQATTNDAAHEDKCNEIINNVIQLARLVNDANRQHDELSAFNARLCSGSDILRYGYKQMSDQLLSIIATVVLVPESPLKDAARACALAVNGGEAFAGCLTSPNVLQFCFDGLNASAAQYVSNAVSKLGQLMVEYQRDAHYNELNDAETSSDQPDHERFTAIAGMDSIGTSPVYAPNGRGSTRLLRKLKDAQDAARHCCSFLAPEHRFDLENTESRHLPLTISAYREWLDESPVFLSEQKETKESSNALEFDDVVFNIN